jgi:hypothetical protein
MKLRIVAGTDLERPPRRGEGSAPTAPPDGCNPLGGTALLEAIEPLHELLAAVKEAQANYRCAVEEIAQRTGRSAGSIGHTLAASKRWQTRRAKRAEPEPDWSDLM